VAAETRFADHDLVRVDLAAEGPDAPVPPGLAALPGEGELAVSPALRDLLDGVEPDLLADRFPGEVTATVGRDALISPDDLVVFVGRAPEELRAEPEVQAVRSIEAAPYTRSLTRIMRVAVAIGIVGLLTPVVMFVATATRLAAARRERRLAALRLAGATPRQVALVAGVEAGMAAVAGTLAGFAAFFAIRPSLAGIPFDGDTFFPSDLHLSWRWAVAVALGVPLLAMATAVVSLRRARITPLGVTRQANRSRRSPRALVLVLVGTVALVGIPTTNDMSDVALATAVAGAFLTIVAGIALSGAWLTSQVGRAVARVGKRAPSLMAARRLQDNPSAGFRAIGGLILAVFVGTVFSTLTASILGGMPDRDDGRMRPDVVAAALPPIPPEPAPGATGAGDDHVPVAEIAPTRWPDVSAAGLTQTTEGLDAIAGVRRVATAYAAPDDIWRTRLAEPGLTLAGEPVVMACDDVAVVVGASCEGTTVVTLGGGEIRTTGIDLGDALPVDQLAGLRPVAFAAATDGTSTAIEQARAVLERHLPGAVARTQADLDASNLSQALTIQRVSNVGLAITVVIAGCSLAVAVAGSIVERRQPFALLRLAGTRLSDLRRIVLAEAAAPLLVVAAFTVGLGMAVTALTLETGGNSPSFSLPDLGYWLSLVGGLAVALGVVAATLPLLDRLTSPESVRFE
jgi:FtsX-like permease family protein